MTSGVNYLNESDLEDRFGGFFQFHGEVLCNVRPHNFIDNWSYLEIDLIDKKFPINSIYKQIHCREEHVQSVTDFIKNWVQRKFLASENKYA